MTILSEEEKADLQVKLTALMNSYRLEDCYVVGCTEQGFAIVLEGLSITSQLQEMARATHGYIMDSGAKPAPSINQN